MISAEKASSHAHRRRKKQLSKNFYVQNTPLDDCSYSKTEPGKEKEKLECGRRSLFFLVELFIRMDIHTKIWFTGIALFVCISVLFLGLYINTYARGELTFCLDLSGRGTCLSTETSPYRFYGTKTAYHIAVPNNTANNTLNIGNCKPTLFYLLSRHATRYPDGDKIEVMQKVLPDLKEKIVSAFAEGKNSICKDDIDKLKKWQLTYVPEDDNRISETGKQEAVILAQRYKKRFPEILDRPYSPQYFEFEYTSRERTHTTAQAFEEGLFGKLRARYVQSKVNDKVLQFHKDCKSLQKKCNSTSINLDELNKFENGQIKKLMLRSVSKRLGFNVTADEVEIMQRACVFGYALAESDIWCSIFSRDELKVMEYADDIDDYYKDGYGNAINYEQACPVVNYIVNFFKSANNQTGGKAVLHFSHAGAVKKVYARFGLFKDDKPLMSNDMCYQQGRKWRSSLIVPFTSNIAFALLQCDGVHKIITFQNEQPVIVDGCNSVFCPLEDFYRKYEGIADSCDINKLCCPCCIA